MRLRFLLLMAIAAIPYVHSPGLRQPNSQIFTNAANAYLTALKKKTVAPPPPPVAATAPAPAAAPPPVSGHWSVPDYQSLISSMPDYVAANADLTAQGGDAESARRASIQRAIIESGFSPSSYHDPYGDLDPTTLSAASSNPQSTLAQLQLARNRGGADLSAALAGRGMLSSGALTGGDQRLMEGFQGAQSSAEQSLLDALNGYTGSYASTQAELTRQRLAAQQQAALEAASQYPANWVTDATGGSYDATAALPPGAVGTTSEGYPTYPTSPEQQAAGATPTDVDPGFWMINGGGPASAPSPSPAPSAPQLYYNPETGQYQTQPYMPGGSAWMA